tara:strand:+ start:721 stop:1059 length:339 start_codon:yes stop_codon:yes gene_type:complete
MKYKEKEIIGLLEDYISSTYSAHYVSEKNAEDFQIQDLFSHIGIAEEFCRGAALKYLVRFGKKEGKNKKDLFKTLHYVVLMYYYAFMQSEEKNLTNQELDDKIVIKDINNPF